MINSVHFEHLAKLVQLFYKEISSSDAFADAQVVKAAYELEVDLHDSELNDNLAHTVKCLFSDEVVRHNVEEQSLSGEFYVSNKKTATCSFPEVNAEISRYISTGVLHVEIEKRGEGQKLSSADYDMNNAAVTGIQKEICSKLQNSQRGNKNSTPIILGSGQMQVTKIETNCTNLYQTQGDKVCPRRLFDVVVNEGNDKVTNCSVNSDTLNLIKGRATHHFSNSVKTYSKLPLELQLVKSAKESVDAQQLGTNTDPGKRANESHCSKVSSINKDTQEQHDGDFSATDSAEGGSDTEEQSQTAARTEPKQYSKRNKREGEKEYKGPRKCEFCEKILPCKAVYERHRLIHTGEKPWECNICGKVFNAKINLKSHEKLHLERERQFGCSQCESMFYTENALQKHMRYVHMENSDKHQADLELKFATISAPRAADNSDIRIVGKKDGLESAKRESQLTPVCQEPIDTHKYRLPVMSENHNKVCEYVSCCCDAAKFIYSIEEKMFMDGILSLNDLSLPALEKALMELGCDLDAAEGVLYSITFNYKDRVLTRYFESGSYTGFMKEKGEPMLKEELQLTDLNLLRIFTYSDICHLGENKARSCTRLDNKYMTKVFHNQTSIKKQMNNFLESVTIKETQLTLLSLVVHCVRANARIYHGDDRFLFLYPCDEIRNQIWSDLLTKGVDEKTCAKEIKAEELIKLPKPRTLKEQFDFLSQIPNNHWARYLKKNENVYSVNNNPCIVNHLLYQPPQRTSKGEVISPYYPTSLRHRILYFLDNGIASDREYSDRLCKEWLQFNHVEPEESIFETNEELPSEGYAKCDICGKVLKTKYNLKKHRELTHSGELYNCIVCNKKFTTAMYLEKHMLVHTDAKPYACSHCDERFRSQTARETHVNTQHTKQVFVCEVCGKSYSTRRVLRNHFARCHDKRKPTECKLCHKKVLNYHGHMKMHRSYDKGEIHTCEICGKSFPLKVYLHQHMKVHKEGKYQCEKCKKFFNFESGWKSHVARGTCYIPEISLARFRHNEQAPSVRNEKDMAAASVTEKATDRKANIATYVVGKEGLTQIMGTRTGAQKTFVIGSSTDLTGANCPAINLPKTAGDTLKVTEGVIPNQSLDTNRQIIIQDGQIQFVHSATQDSNLITGTVEKEENKIYLKPSNQFINTSLASTAVSSKDAFFQVYPTQSQVTVDQSEEQQSNVVIEENIYRSEDSNMYLVSEGFDSQFILEAAAIEEINKLVYTQELK